MKLLFFGSFFLMSLIARAQSGDGPVSYRWEAPATVARSDSFSIGIRWNIQSRWHIYAPTGVNESQGMIETRIRFELPGGMRLGDRHLPDYVQQGPYQVYQGNNVIMRWDIKFDSSLRPGTYEIQAHLTYQSCNEDVCFPPRSVKEKIIVKVYQ